MVMIDERGRLFGRFNLVDAVVVALLAGVIPLAYGAFMLFRAPPPSLVSIEPAQLQTGRNLRVTVRGANLRPYMRVSFGTLQGMSFLFSDPTTAQVELGDIAPGVYDVILYDQARERARLPKALTIAAPPKPDVEVDLSGVLTGLPAAVAKAITAGLELPGVGRVVRVGTPVAAASKVVVGPGAILEVPVANAVNLPATIRAACAVVQRGSGVTCDSATVPLMQGIVIAVSTPAGPHLFQVDQVRATTPLEPFTVRVRFVGEREAIEKLRAGDHDLSAPGDPAATSVLSAGAARTVTSGLAMSLTVVNPTQIDPILIAGEMAAREVTLRVPLQRTLEGWTFAGRPARAGATLTLKTADYELRGTVIDVTPVAASTSGSKAP